MNNKVKFLRGTSDEYTAAEKDNDVIYFTTDDGKLYIGDKEISSGGSYKLPIATTEILGGVMPDGTTINVDENGVISAVGGSGGGLELIGEYYISSSTAELTTIISTADYKEGDIYLILVRPDSGHWSYVIYTLIALPTSPKIYSLNCVPSVETSARSVSIRLDSAGLSISDQAYYKLYKMKVG